MQVVELEVRDVYGIPNAYPANMTARIIAQLIGTKTIPRNRLTLLDDLDFEIVLSNYPGIDWDEYRDSRGTELA